jgi:Uncharacterised protein family (UPF0158)
VLPTQQAQLVGRPNPSKRLRNQDDRALEPGKPYLSAGRAFWIWSAAGGGSIVAFVLDLSLIDLEDIAIALADQNDYEHHWLISPGIGEIAFWTADTGIDGQTPVDLDELDLIVIDPLPTWVWYQDMADFASGLTSERAGQRLARAIRGKGAFRRFKDELHQEYQGLLPAWYAFSDARAMRRAVQWLADNSLIDDDSAERFLSGHPDPALP